MPDILLGSGGTMGKKRFKTFCPQWSLYSNRGRQTIDQATNYMICMLGGDKCALRRIRNAGWEKLVFK